MCFLVVFNNETNTNPKPDWYPISIAEHHDKIGNQNSQNETYLQEVLKLELSNLPSLPLGINQIHQSAPRKGTSILPWNSLCVMFQGSSPQCHQPVVPSKHMIIVTESETFANFAVDSACTNHHWSAFAVATIIQIVPDPSNQNILDISSILK